ncbi:hypothetical protein [Rhodanobacter spathiphylli]|uniref:hypothetical protein n=1 Tax=Rhodanobacter spathiphylli TaxID=347483 RepID=UPI0012FA3DC0|nr:hypothetical protein [Rhodanobacter spathiphylli]
MDSRESVLKALLSYTRPIPDIARDLSAYGWDAPNPLVVLDATHLSSALNRFMAGALSAVQVEAWANCIECRDDIEYNPSSAIGLALHELANPLLTCPLTRQSAATLVAALA